MARDPHLQGVDANAAIRAEIDRLAREITLLESRTTTTIRQDSVGAVQDPLEGEVIIDYGEHKIRWYSNGAWHECICGEAA